MKKPLFIITIVLLILLAGIFLIKNRQESDVASSPTPLPELPVNTIPVTERPYVTLTPDTSSRNLFLTLTGSPKEGELEYEMVYQAGDKQEGVFGRLDLENESQPIEKKLLLGSQSAGGKVTYHEGVTGGSLTLTYTGIKLKEQWNFLHFDPADPVVTATDGRFSITLGKSAYKKDQAIVVMKPFGLPMALPAGTLKLVAGPYSYLGPAVKGEVVVELKLPAGTYASPAILGFDGTAWVSLTTSSDGETLTAKSTSMNTFVAVSE